MFFTIFVVGFVVYLLSEGSPKVLSPDMSLASFRELNADERGSLVDELMTTTTAAENDRDAFISCTGDFAVTKNQNLSVREVFGWCDTERINNRARFTSHFDEAAMPADHLDAFIICQGFVKDQLRAPSSARFPVSANTIYRSRGSFRVKSQVEAENAFGVLIRQTFVCDATYHGPEHQLNSTAWTLNALELN